MDITQKVVYIVENDEDAQKTKTAGGYAAALDDMEMLKKGIDICLERFPDKLLAFVLDPEAADLAEKYNAIREQLKDRKTPHFINRHYIFADEKATSTIVSLIEEKSTGNAREALEELTQDFLHAKKNADDMRAGKLPVKDYKEAFLKNRTNNAQGIRSGYKKIDIALNGGFRDELYVMTSGTGTGKSAFAAVLAQNMAQGGAHVLYYCLEMGRDEFIARGVSMISREQQTKKRQAIPFSAILGEKYNEKTKAFEMIPASQYEDFLDEYIKRYGARLYFRQGGIGSTNAREIAAEVEKYKEDHAGVRVVCIIDYLQLLSADPMDHAQRDAMATMSAAVKTLKALASQKGVTVIALSSKSNSEAFTASNEYSGKYSGDIGYTAGISIGWEWDRVTNGGSETERNNAEREAKEVGYRAMLFSINKYRSGERHNAVHVNYYPAYNYFEVEDEDGFLPAQVTPFDKDDT